MDSQEHIEQYGNYLQGDSDFVEPFLSESQNPSMPIQSLPEVEIVTFNSTKSGGNFNVDEDLLLILHGLTLAWMLCMVLNKMVKKFGRKFGNTFVRTILMEPHVLVPPY